MNIRTLILHHTEILLAIGFIIAGGAYYVGYLVGRCRGWESCAQRNAEILRERERLWQRSSGQYGISPRSDINPPSTPSGGESAPVGGVVRHASGAYTAAPGAPHTAAPIGHSVEAPGGGMTAMQIDSSNFSVTTNSGASRVFSGNIGQAQTLARAYNNTISQPTAPPTPAT